MIAIAESVISEILATTIIVAAKKLFGETFRNDNEDSLEIIVKNYINNKLDNYYDTDLDSGIFYNFLNSSQVADIIQNYISYNITGILNKRFKLKYKSDNKNIDKTQVVSYLCKNTVDLFNNNGKTINTLLVNNFFNEYIDSIILFFESNLNIKEKGQIFLVNNRISLLEERVYLYINKLINGYKNELVNILRQSLKIQVEPQNSDYELIRNEYIKLLRKNNQRGFIYGFSDFRLDDFYVLPEFSVENNNMNFLLKENFITGEFQKIQDIDYESFIIRGNVLLNNNLPSNVVFDNNNIIYIIGGAGYGKSLFLKYVINNYNKMELFNDNVCLPIYCDLKDYHKQNPTKPCSIVDFLKNSIIKSTLIDNEKITTNFINHYLNSGRCLILFDALDEVKKEYRKDLHDRITNFFLEHNSNNKICITSRDRGFIPNEDIEVFSICDLNSTQIEDFINNLIKLNHFNKNDKELFLSQAKVLLQKKFLKNFLSLSLLVSIFKAEKELPENKVELYSKCFEYISKKREIEKDKDTNKYDFKLMQSLLNDSSFVELALLAFPNNQDIDESKIREKFLKLYKVKYPDENTTENAITEFMNFCSERTDLVVNANEDNKYKFFHRSFFEYFYAKYIFRIQNEVDIYNQFLNFDIDSEIHELVISMIKSSDVERYQKIMNYIILKNKTDFDLNSFNIFTLTMQAVDDFAFMNDYFKIIVNHKDLFIDYREKHIVQEIVILTIQKIIQNSDFEKEFRDTFILYALRDIILIVFNIANANTKVPITKDGINSANIKLRFYLHNNVRCLFTPIIFEKIGIESFLDIGKNINRKEYIAFINTYETTRKSRKVIFKAFDFFLNSEKEELLKYLAVL